MSGIPIIGKVFDAIKESKLLQLIVVASVIYFTAGAGSASFTAEGASVAAGGGGIGATTTATATSTGVAGAQAAGATAAGTAGATAIPAAIPAAAPVATAAAPSWFAANPMATMMLGQGVMGAASSYEQEKTEKAALAQREKERKERGLFGFDFEGKPGVVSSNMAAPGTVAAPTAPGEPIVSGQKIAGSSIAPQQVPIMRKDLPKLNQAGQLTTG